MNVKIKRFIENKNNFLCYISVFLYSVGLLLFSLYYSTSVYGKSLFFSYFKFGVIIVLNWLPIIFMLILMYLIMNSVGISCILTGIVVVILSLINYFKLQFRDDPFLFEDFSNFLEAKEMIARYKIVLTKGMLCSIILICAFAIVMFIFKQKIKFISIRVTGVLICIVCLFLTYGKVYCDGSLYESIENYDLLNRWGETQRFISRGFLYPFIYSSKSAFPEKPDHYDITEAKKIMDNYTDEEISESKKVHIIGIMLEAYNDFSKFAEIEFDNDPYTYFHELQEQSYTGELVTNIFAGGTINTERAFLTGYTKIPSMRKKTSTWVQYFKDQGYATMGRHQCYGWFYNRKNINENIGFDEYSYYEEAYGDYDINNLIRHGDNVLMEDIISDFEKNNKTCFSFSVTYQNHGPYSIERQNGKNYLRSDIKLDDNERNIFNNYLEGIEETGCALKNLVEYFKENNEPVVLILFGDHNPWLGDGNSVYEELNINLDLETEEGYFNYYSTPYVIWGNDAAKNVLGTTIEGKGSRISPNFLMNEVFEVLGYKGNRWMQYTSEIKRKISVIGVNAYLDNGKFTRKLSDESREKLEEYDRIQYYWLHDKK